MRSIYWSVVDSRRRPVANGFAMAADDHDAIIKATTELQPKARADEWYRVSAGDACAVVYGEDLQPPSVQEVRIGAATVAISHVCAFVRTEIRFYRGTLPIVVKACPGCGKVILP